MPYDLAAMARVAGVRVHTGHVQHQDRVKDAIAKLPNVVAMKAHIARMEERLREIMSAGSIEIGTIEAEALDVPDADLSDAAWISFADVGNAASLAGLLMGRHDSYESAGRAIVSEMNKAILRKRGKAGTILQS